MNLSSLGKYNLIPPTWKVIWEIGLKIELKFITRVLISLLND